MKVKVKEEGNEESGGLTGDGSGCEVISWMRVLGRSGYFSMLVYQVVMMTFGIYAVVKRRV